MKKLITVIAILIGSLSYAQEYNTKALYPNYVETYEFEFGRELELYKYRNKVIPVLPEYRNNTNIYIKGNLNTVNIVKVEQRTYNPPKPNTDEYSKTNTFDPNKISVDKFGRKNK